MKPLLSAAYAAAALAVFTIALVLAAARVRKQGRGCQSR
jgi:hypothetical protein